MLTSGGNEGLVAGVARLCGRHRRVRDREPVAHVVPMARLSHWMNNWKEGGEIRGHAGVVLRFSNNAIKPPYGATWCV